MVLEQLEKTLSHFSVELYHYEVLQKTERVYFDSKIIFLNLTIPTKSLCSALEIVLIESEFILVLFWFRTK